MWRAVPLKSNAEQEMGSIMRTLDVILLSFALVGDALTEPGRDWKCGDRRLRTLISDEQLVGMQ